MLFCTNVFFFFFLWSEGIPGAVLYWTLLSRNKVCLNWKRSPRKVTSVGHRAGATHLFTFTTFKNICTLLPTLWTIYKSFHPLVLIFLLLTFTCLVPCKHAFMSRRSAKNIFKKSPASMLSQKSRPDVGRSRWLACGQTESNVDSHLKPILNLICKN